MKPVRLILFFILALLVPSLIVPQITNAQDSSDVAAVCNTPEFNAAQQAYMNAVSSNADTVTLEAARQAFADLVANCYTQVDVNELQIDNGPVIHEDHEDGLSTDYVLFGNKWGGGTQFNTATNPQIPGGTVYWSFMPSGPMTPANDGAVPILAYSSLPTYQACFDTEIRNAFAAWEAVSNIQFVEIADSGAAVNSAQGYFAHIRVGGHVMDGTFSVLAHAFFPPPNGATISGDLHFDVAENWQCNPGPGQIDVGLVALHEIGHAIGLQHEPTALAVMNATYNASLSTLQTDDINGTRAIYGNSGIPGINIADGLTGPYPASKTVSGLGSIITDVNVSLNGLYHTWPDDMDILLVSPGGQAVPLMSDACGTSRSDNRTITFDDAAASAIPFGVTCPSGTFKPADYGGAETYPGAPAGPYGTTLSAFNGSNPNGVWSLYIIDDTLGDTGGIVTWDLDIDAYSPPTISINDVTLAEGNSGTTDFIFTVSLSHGDSTQTITVDYATANGSASAGSDYTVTNGTLTFVPGDTSETITVSVSGDTAFELAETFNVNLSNPTNASINDGEGLGTISNDEPQPTINITPTSGLTTTEAGGTAQFTVTLSQQPTASVVIALSTSDTTEGLVPASVGLNTTNWNTGVTVTITGRNDAIADGNIAYTIITGTVTSGDLAYSSIAAATIPDVSVTNLDDETSTGIIITPTSGLVTTEAGGTAVFNVKLATQPTANVTVALSSSDTTEGTVPSGVTLTTVNWNTGVNVTVTGKDDVLDDGDIAYTIITGAVTSADPAYSSIAASSIADVSVTTTDDDTSGFNITPTSGLVTTEVGGTATFSIKLTSRPSANVTIALSSSDTTEGTVRSFLTFTPDTWNLARTVIVTGVNDALADGNIGYSIITGTVTSGDTLYAALDPAAIPDISVTNTDDETSPSAAAVTSISPVGTLSQSPVTFNWTGNASSYHLNLLQEVSVEGELQTFALLKNSYEASVVCSNGLCSVQPDIPLIPGVTYVWIVEAVSADGQVIGSAALSFTMPSVTIEPVAPELPELVPVNPVSPDAPGVELPEVVPSVPDDEITLPGTIIGQ